MGGRPPSRRNASRARTVLDEISGILDDIKRVRAGTEALPEDALRAYILREFLPLLERAERLWACLGTHGPRDSTTTRALVLFAQQMVALADFRSDLVSTPHERDRDLDTVIRWAERFRTLPGATPERCADVGSRATEAWLKRGMILHADKRIEEALRQVVQWAEWVWETAPPEGKVRAAYLAALMLSRAADELREDHARADPQSEAVVAWADRLWGLRPVPRISNEVLVVTTLGATALDRLCSPPLLETAADVTRLRKVLGYAEHLLGEPPREIDRNWLRFLLMAVDGAHRLTHGKTFTTTSQRHADFTRVGEWSELMWRHRALDPKAVSFCLEALFCGAVHMTDASSTSRYDTALSATFALVRHVSASARDEGHLVSGVVVEGLESALWALGHHLRRLVLKETAVFPDIPTDDEALARACSRIAGAAWREGAPPTAPELLAFCKTLVAQIVTGLEGSGRPEVSSNAHVTLEEALAPVVASVFVAEDDWSEFVRCLDLALRALASVGRVTGFLIALTGDLAQGLANLPPVEFARRRASIERLLAALEARGGDDASAPWKRARLMVRLALGHLLGRLSWTGGDASEVALAAYDRLVEGVQRDLHVLLPEDFRMRSVAALQAVLQERVEIAWELRGARRLPDAGLAERVLSSQALGDLLLRLRERLPMANPTAPGALAVHEGALARAVRLSREENLCIVAFFDTTWRIVRLRVEGERLTVDALGREAVHEACAAYEGAVAALAPGQGFSEADRHLRAAVADVATQLFAEVPARALLVLPSGVMHDAAAAASAVVADRCGVGARQDVSVEAQAALRDSERARRALPSAAARGPTGRRPTVLVVVSGEIDTYRMRVGPAVATRLAAVSDVLSYTFDALPLAPGRHRFLHALERVTPSGRTPLGTSLARVEPDVLLWLVHGNPNTHHVDGGVSLERAYFTLSERADAAWLRINPTTIGRGVITLPLARSPTGGHVSADNVLEEGFEIGLGRCRLVLSGACSSGRVGEVLGSEAAGLLRGFLVAGVPVVVAPVWDVAAPVVAASAAPTALEALWLGLVDRLTAADGGTIGDSVAAARQAAAGAGFPFADWAYLTVHGYGGAPSPWRASSPDAASLA